jgi:hypothetical protein
MITCWNVFVGDLAPHAPTNKVNKGGQSADTYGWSHTRPRKLYLEQIQEVMNKQIVIVFCNDTVVLI